MNRVDHPIDSEINASQLTPPTNVSCPQARGWADGSSPASAPISQQFFHAESSTVLRRCSKSA